MDIFEQSIGHFHPWQWKPCCGSVFHNAKHVILDLNNELLLGATHPHIQGA